MYQRQTGVADFILVIIVLVIILFNLLIIQEPLYVLLVQESLCLLHSHQDLYSAQKVQGLQECSASQSANLPHALEESDRPLAADRGAHVHVRLSEYSLHVALAGNRVREWSLGVEETYLLKVL